MKELILYALRRFCMLIPFLIGLTLVAFLFGLKNFAFSEYCISIIVPQKPI